MAGGQTLSASEFAQLCGVTRERLRTWERRHGFPAPVRLAGGSRRYALDDVARVVAVRRAIEDGTPVAAAITGAQLRTDGGISEHARAALAEHAPVAVVAISGPRPLRIEYVNATARGHADAPQPGELLLERAPWFEQAPGHRVLQRLFSGSTIAAASCEHPDWTSGMTGRARSLAYRLPSEPGERPLVALVGIDTERERATRGALAEAEADRERLRARLDEQERWSAAAAEAVMPLASEPGAAALMQAADALVRRLSAADAAVATSLSGQIGVGRSARGRIGPALVTVTAHEDLAAAVRAGEPAWLSESCAEAFAAPAGLALLIAPVRSGGELLGALLIAFPERVDLAPEPLRLLGVAAAAAGFGLLRERVVGELRDGLGPLLETSREETG